MAKNLSGGKIHYKQIKYTVFRKKATPEREKSAIPGGFFCEKMMRERARRYGAFPPPGLYFDDFAVYLL